MLVSPSVLLYLCSFPDPIRIDKEEKRKKKKKEGRDEIRKTEHSRGC